MFETRIQISEGEHLTLDHMAQNVAVKGWEQDDILLRLREGDAKELKLEHTETGPLVSARVSCELRVPAALPLTIRQVQANLSVKGLHNELSIEQVRGDLNLRSVEKAEMAEVYGNLGAAELSSLHVTGTVYGTAAVKGVAAVDVQNVRGNLQVRDTGRLRASRIGGNLQAKGIEGALEVDKVGGNAHLKNVTGAASLEQVAGNLVARNLTAGAKVPKIGGNLVLNGEIGEGRTYHFSVRGNATLRLPEQASAHLTLEAKGRIHSSLSLANQSLDGERLTGTLGEGSTEIAIEAWGNIVAAGGKAETGAELGEEISRQIEESMSAIDIEALGRQVGGELDAAMSRLQVKLEGVDWEHFGVQAQRAAERAMGQLQRNMDRMVEKAARQQEKMERHVEREARRAERMEQKRQAMDERRYEINIGVDDEPVEPVAAPAEPEPDLEEERLSILRMVEQGQITPQDAEMLLDALD